MLEKDRLQLMVMAKQDTQNKTEFRSILIIRHRNLSKMDQKLKCKTWKYEISRRKRGGGNSAR